MKLKKKKTSSTESKIKELDYAPTIIKNCLSNVLPDYLCNFTFLIIRDAICLHSFHTIISKGSKPINYQQLCKSQHAITIGGPLSIFTINDCRIF